MNSWTVLLMLDMVRGRYLDLALRPTTPYDWWTLWAMAHGMVGGDQWTVLASVEG